jgi:hypothetical protein
MQSIEAASSSNSRVVVPVMLTMPRSWMCDVDDDRVQSAERMTILKGFSLYRNERSPKAIIARAQCYFAPTKVVPCRQPVDLHSSL